MRRAARRVELVGAGEHVRAGRDDVAPVQVGCVEAARHFLRDRPCSGHPEAVAEVAGRNREVEDDRLRVGRLDARDHLGLAGLERRHALDHVVVEPVLRDERRRADSLHRVEDVLGRDLAVQRRPELDAVLEMERVRQAVLRDRAEVRCKVRDKRRCPERRQRGCSRPASARAGSSRCRSRRRDTRRSGRTRR